MLPSAVWGVALAAHFLDQAATYQTMRLLKQEGTSKWQSYELNPLLSYLLKRLGPEGILYALPITTGILIMVLNYVSRGLLPSEGLWFFAGAWFVTFETHAANLILLLKNRKAKKVQEELGIWKVC